MSTKFTPADYIMYSLILVSCALWILQSWNTSDTADTVANILVEGELVHSISLNSEQTQIAVDGKLGESIIEIGGGQARFIASPCTGKQCIHSGWLRRTGSTAICLPNRVTLHIAGTTNEIDGVTF